MLKERFFLLFEYFILPFLSFSYFYDYFIFWYVFSYFQLGIIWLFYLVLLVCQLQYDYFTYSTEQALNHIFTILFAPICQIYSYYVII